MLDLYGEGIVSPSAEEIAAKSGVSRRSVFRYFDDLDELCRAAITRQKDRVGHLFAVENSGEGGLEARIEALVQQRVRLYQAIAPVARVARMRAPMQPVLARQIRVDGAQLRGQVERQFEPELKSYSDDEREAALSAADILTSFEAFEIVSERQNKDTEALANTMRAGLSAIFRR
jgi:AcrR family transcriptional regulator